MSDEMNPNPSNNKSAFLPIIIAIVVILFGCFTVVTVFQIFNDEVWLVPGNPDNFDPVASYAMVLDYAGADAQLTQIEALFVQQDGTLDLNASYEPAPEVRYLFYRQTRNNDAPTGTAASDAIWHRRVQITISKPYEWAFVTSQPNDDAGFSFALNLGMDRDREAEQLAVPFPALPAPECSFADFWAVALANNDMPPDAVATIIYDAIGYTFLIQGTPINLTFDQTCELQ
ncbi:MAG: hypothetical protein WBC91_25980 [Phototrophicaceae bacterium]